MHTNNVRVSSCAGSTSGLEVWMALIIKDQADRLDYWLRWHFDLGASRVLVYDNDSVDTQVNSS